MLGSGIPKNILRPYLRQMASWAARKSVSPFRLATTCTPCATQSAAICSNSSAVRHPLTLVHTRGNASAANTLATHIAVNANNILRFIFVPP